MRMAFRSIYRITSFAAAFVASSATTVAGMSALNEVRLPQMMTDGSP